MENMQASQQQGPAQADPKQQENYEKVVLAGMQVIYSDETHEGIMKSLQAGAQDPAKALADTAVLVVTQLDEKAGGQIPRDVIMHASMEILGQIIELATTANVLQADEQAMKAAAQQMTATLAQQFEGEGQQVQQQPPVAAQQPASTGLINQARGGV